MADTYLANLSKASYPYIQTLDSGVGAKAYDQFFAVKSLPTASAIAVVGRISFCGIGSPLGDATGTSFLSQGVFRNSVEGSPAAPCIELLPANIWRFRWSLRTGNHSISIKVKQVTSVSGQRPTLTVKANSLAGITNDVSGSAPVGSDWVTLGPVSVTATAKAAVWVELKNNLLFHDSMGTDCHAFFDHVTTT